VERMRKVSILFTTKTRLTINKGNNNILIENMKKEEGEVKKSKVDIVYDEYIMKNIKK